MLDLGPTKAPPRTAIAVAQLVQRHALSKLSEDGGRRRRSFPVTLRPPAEDYAGDDDIICRRPTLYTEVAGGRAVWDDRSVVFAGGGDALWWTSTRRRGTGRPDAGARRLLRLGRAVVADGRRRRAIDGGRAPSLGLRRSARAARASASRLGRSRRRQLGRRRRRGRRRPRLLLGGLTPGPQLRRRPNGRPRRLRRPARVSMATTTAILACGGSPTTSPPSSSRCSG